MAQAWDVAIFDQHGGVPMFARPSPWVGTLRVCPTHRPPELAEQLRAITSRPAALRRRPYLIERQGNGHIPLTWYLGQPKAVLLEIVAHCVAHALCDPDSGERTEVAGVARESIADLCDASDFALADVWKPTPEWLKGYGKAKTLEALRQIGALGDDAALTKGKAAEIYAAAAPPLAEKRWVPAYGLVSGRGGA